MATLNACHLATPVLIGKPLFLAPGKLDFQPRKPAKCFVPRVSGLGMQPLRLNWKRREIFPLSEFPVKHPSAMRTASMICAAALSARCSGETQTIQQETTKITNAPLDNKEKSPDLDDGGAGFPPRDDDDGGGGGGGGGGWQGGFFFFGFLAFLGFMKDNEGEGSYRNKKGRRKLNKL